MTGRGRTAVITGASSGIGKQLALDFAGRGAALVLAARRAALLDDATQCRAKGVDVEAMMGDLGERAFAESVGGARGPALRAHRLPRQQRRHSQAQAVLRRDTRGSRGHDADQLHGPGPT